MVWRALTRETLYGQNRCSIVWNKNISVEQFYQKKKPFEFWPLGPLRPWMGFLRPEMSPPNPGMGPIRPWMGPPSPVMGPLMSEKGALRTAGWTLSDLGRVLSGLRTGKGPLRPGMSPIRPGMDPLEFGIIPVTEAAPQVVWKVSWTPIVIGILFQRACRIDGLPTEISLELCRECLLWPSNNQKPPVTVSVHETSYFLTTMGASDIVE